MQARVDKYYKQWEKDTNVRVFPPKKKSILLNYAFHYNLAEKDLSSSLGLLFSRSMSKFISTVKYTFHVLGVTI